MITDEEVCSKLRDLILREEVLPNERLVESAYAERFGTNRNVVRRALGMLEREGLVVIEQFKGAHVRRLTGKEAVEITEVRAALESLLVRHAAQRATDEDKLALREALRHAQRSLAQGTAIETGGAARRVREQIWRISAHETGRQIMSTLNSQLIRIWFHAILQPGRAAQIVDDITRVVAAIEANQPHDAVAAIHDYHANSMDALLLALDGGAAPRRSLEMAKLAV
jgi:DNA-binding GntR family transcriptional regulator